MAAPPSRRITLVDARPAKIARRFDQAFVVEASLPVYSATLIQLARYGIASLAPSGLALLVLPPEGPKILVEVNGTQEPVRVVSGPTVDALHKALNRKTVSAQSARSTASIFRVPALHLYALWRRAGTRTETSVFLPYGANHAGMTAGRQYKFPRFEKAVRNSATEQILLWYERYERELSSPASSSGGDLTISSKSPQRAVQVGRGSVGGHRVPHRERNGE
jgi:hypothetical protein